MISLMVVDVELGGQPSRRLTDRVILVEIDVEEAFCIQAPSLHRLYNVQ